MEELLQLVSYELVLIFGVLVSCYFANLPRTRNGRISIALFILVSSTAQFISYYAFGMETTTRLYPLFAHLPLAVYMVLFYKRSWTMALACVFSAYLCCQTNRWFGTVTMALTGNASLAYVLKMIAVFPLLHLMREYVAPPAHKLMNTSNRSLLLFAALPAAYYVFDYIVGVYSGLLYEGIQVAVEFMPSAMSVCYFVFIMLYSGEIQRRMESEKEQMMLTMQTRQSVRDIEALRESQKQAAIYRHDLRHHLMLISALADEKNVDKLKAYIHSTQQGIASITPAHYCENEVINLILSAFRARAEQEGITLVIKVGYPAQLHLEDIELCTLFSNALENAINATAKYEGEMAKTIHLIGRVHESQLLIMVENPYSGTVDMENGMPRNRAPGHGMGVKSIISVTERYGGLWTFSANNGLFTLKIVV